MDNKNNKLSKNIDDIEFINNSFNIYEIQIELSLSNSTIQRYIEVSKVFKEYRKIGNMWYVPKEEIFELKEFFENNYILKDVEKILNIEKHAIIRLINRNILKNCKMFTNRWYIPKNQIESYLMEREVLKQEEKCKKIEEALLRLNNIEYKISMLDNANQNEKNTFRQNIEINTTAKDDLHEIENLIKNKNERYKLLYNELKIIKKNQKNMLREEELRRVTKENEEKKFREELNRVAKEIEKKKLREEQLKRLKKRNEKKKRCEEELSRLKKENEKKKEFYKDNYYTKADLLNKYDIRNNVIIRTIKKGKIAGYLLILGKMYIPKKLVDDDFYYLKRNCITLEEVCAISGKSKRWVSYNIEKYKIKQTTPLFGEQIYILIEDYVRLEKSEKEINLFKEKVNMCNSFNEMIDLYFNDTIDDKYTRTRKLFIEFTKYKIKKSHSHDKKRIVQQHINAYSKLKKVINKEANLLNDTELSNITKDKLIGSCSLNIIAQFFNYCLRNINSECCYDTVVMVYPKRNNYSVKDDDEIKYSKEIWLKYLIYLSLIDYHIDRAFDDEKYANCWLFLLLNLSLSWRKSDILRIPKFYNPFPEINNSNWFDNNKFDLAHAKAVIDSVGYRISDLDVRKTGANTNFIVSEYLVVPTAIAFLACNKFSDKVLFEKINKRSDINKVLNSFIEIEELKIFSNRKANKTVETTVFDMAVNIEGMAFLAYGYCGDMRSHTKNIKNLIAEATSIYINSTNRDGSANNVSLNLFIRGHFGELFHMISEIAYGDLSNKTILEVSEMIRKLRERFEPKNLENISGFLLEVRDTGDSDKIDLYKQLLKADRSEVRELLESISKFQMPSKVHGIQCLIHPKCIEPIQAVLCNGCIYSLPTIYCLKEIENELFGLLEKYEELKENNLEKIKIKFFIKKFLNIIVEAQKEYIVNGNANFIESLIDMTTLKEKVKKNFAKEKK